MKPPAMPRWRAVQGGAGEWRIVDELGAQPLRSSDPFDRATAVHLAAAAPQLYSALLWLVQDMHQLELRPLHLRHRVRLNFAEVALIEAKPPYRLWLKLVHSHSQQELDLAA